jgi:hypothetical protein
MSVMNIIFIQGGLGRGTGVHPPSLRYGETCPPSPARAGYGATSSPRPIHRRCPSAYSALWRDEMAQQEVQNRADGSSWAVFEPCRPGDARGSQDLQCDLFWKLAVLHESYDSSTNITFPCGMRSAELGSAIISIGPKVSIQNFGHFHIIHVAGLFQLRVLGTWKYGRGRAEFNPYQRGGIFQKNPYEQ